MPFFICYYFQGLHSQNTAPLQTYTKHTKKTTLKKKEKNGGIYIDNTLFNSE